MQLSKAVPQQQQVIDLTSDDDEEDAPTPIQVACESATPARPVVPRTVQPDSPNPDRVTFTLHQPPQTPLQHAPIRPPPTSSTPVQLPPQPNKATPRAAAVGNTGKPAPTTAPAPSPAPANGNRSAPKTPQTQAPQTQRLPPTRESASPSATAPAADVFRPSSISPATPDSSTLETRVPAALPLYQIGGAVAPMTDVNAQKSVTPDKPASALSGVACPVPLYPLIHANVVADVSMPTASVTEISPGTVDSPMPQSKPVVAQQESHEMSVQPNTCPPTPKQTVPTPELYDPSKPTCPVSDSDAVFPQLFADHDMEVTHNALKNICASTSECIRTCFFNTQDSGTINRPHKPNPNPRLIREITSVKPKDSTIERKRPPPNHLPPEEGNKKARTTQEDDGSALQSLLPIFMQHTEQLKSMTSQVIKEHAKVSSLELSKKLYGELERCLLLLDSMDNQRKLAREANERTNAAKRALIEKRKAELIQLRQQSKELRDQISAAPAELLKELTELQQGKKP
ncbi:hypothetical protein Pelo_3436 [Pelomyxa schiedti]|nr:hypothetical protein Pelo_3436 [Pelomyxa schiedti]